MTNRTDHPWHYSNPVQIHFGEGLFARLPALIAGRPYVLVTYAEPLFQQLAAQLSAQQPPLLVVDSIRANPDLEDIRAQYEQLGQLEQTPELIVAIGGGSVLDTAKALAASRQGFSQLHDSLVSGQALAAACWPIIAVPTTAGTGSEVTCWGTIWHRQAGRKYSVKSPALYPERALIDPLLTAALPLELTRQTALDALSHALESLWNANRNPVSDTHAVRAAG